MREVSATAVQAWAAHLGIAPTELDSEALRSDLARGTLPGVLADAARTNAGSTLIVNGKRLTHAQLHARAARAASVLAASGVSRGTRVVINAPTSMRLVVSYFAALHVGGVVTLTNPTCSATELDAVVERSGADLVLAEDGFERTTTVPVRSMRELIKRAEWAVEHAPVQLGSEDVALLAFTSGTTGSPKGVPLTHGQLLASIRSAMLAWRWSSTDTLVHALPLFHQHGLSGVHASLIAGSNAAILARFDPEELLATVVRERATILFGVPSIHHRLMRLDPERLAPLRRLRLITSGSAPLSAALAGAFREKTGMLPLERYGLTETGLDVSNTYEGERAVGTVGYPLPGVEVALTDPQGDPVGAGTVGEIVLRGPQVFEGYLDDPAATSAAFWPDGWFRTGDLGRWDVDGPLVICGRLKDLVITGGMNVTPQEVEQVVEQFPGVSEAAVAGLPSERWGEEVAVWVVTNEGSTVDPEELIAHCRLQLAAYKCPKQVFGVDELPRNAIGKLTRSRLTGTTTP